MSPLNVEVLHNVDKQWIKLGEVGPLDKPGSLSNIKSKGKKDIYLFKCEKDDSKSVIYKSESKNVADFSELKIVQEIKKGESFIINMKTDGNAKKVRFSQK
jgi:hypothetical protein